MNKNLRSIGIVLMVLFAAYSIAWKYYSKKFEHHIESELVAIQSKGFEVSFDNLHISGYPFGYNVVVKNLEIKRGSVFKTWVDGPITFSARVWKPQEISSVAGGSHHMKFDDVKTEGTGFAIKSFTFDPMRFDFSYQNLSISVAGQPVLKAKEFEYDMDLTPKDKSDTATIKLRMETCEIDKLKGEPLGTVIQNIILDASLKGPITGDTNYMRAKNWYEADGLLEVKNIALKWGEASVVGDGTITLDDNLQLIAAFSASFTGLQDVVGIYVKAGVIDKPKAGMIKAGVALFHDSNGKKIAVTIQNRRLSLSSIPILQLPEIKW